MTPVLRIVLSIGILFYFIIVLRLIHSKKLTLKYALLWLLMGGVFVCLIIWPHLLSIVCRLIGIETPMNALFTIAVMFSLVLIMSLTSIVSKQDEKIKVLVQEIGMLEDIIRKMK